MTCEATAGAITRGPEQSVLMNEVVGKPGDKRHGREAASLAMTTRSRRGDGQDVPVIVRSTRSLVTAWMPRNSHHALVVRSFMISAPTRRGQGLHWLIGWHLSRGQLEEGSLKIGPLVGGQHRADPECRPAELTVPDSADRRVSRRRLGEAGQHAERGGLPDTIAHPVPPDLRKPVIAPLGSR